MVLYRSSPRFATAWVVPLPLRHLFLQLRVAQASVPLRFLTTPVWLGAGMAWLGGVRVLRLGCLSPPLPAAIFLHMPVAFIPVTPTSGASRGTCCHLAP